MPVINDKKTLTFVCYQLNDVLTKNRYGILEPTSTLNKIDVKLLDIIILPLLAFDRAGHRLGTGGGYYDKTFAFIQTCPPAQKKPYLIGLGYAIQKAPTLSHEAWDICLDAVLTEQGFWKIYHEQ